MRRPFLSTAATRFAPFTPTQFPGLAAWYDASDLSTITYDAANSVSVWADKSFNRGRNLLQAAGAAQPTLTRSDNKGNMLLRTEAMTVAPWTLVGTTTIVGGAVDPNGGLLAFTLGNFDAALWDRFYQGVGTDRVAGKVFTCGIWAKASGGNIGKQFILEIRRGGAGTFSSASVTVTLTGSWTFYSIPVPWTPHFDNVGWVFVLGTVGLLANTANSFDIAFPTMRETTWDSDYITTTTTQAHPGLNGKPVIRFNGTSHYLKTAAFTLNQPLTIYLVFREEKLGDYVYVYDGFVGADTSLVEILALGPYCLETYGGVGLFMNNLTLGIKNHCAVFKGTTSAAQKELQPPVTGNAGTTSPDGFTIGSFASGVAGFTNISVAEIIVYNQAHDLDQRLQVEQYLARKWNLGLNSETYDAEGILNFTINYLGTFTAPYFVASTLVDADFVWTRPDGATTSAKAPAAAFFTMSGRYFVTCKNWAAVTEIHFEQAATRDWLRSSNFGAILKKTTALTNFRTYFNTAYADNVSDWVLPASLTDFRSSYTAITGSISGWTLPTPLIYLYLQNTGVSGDISSWTLPSSLQVFYIHTTSVSGNINSWSLPASLVQFVINTTALSGDVSRFVFPAGLTTFYVYNSSVTYGTAGTAFAGITAGDVINASGCGWTQTMVDKALANAVTSGAGASTLNLGGNAVPSAAGMLNVATLRAAGWTVTVSEMEFVINYLGTITAPYLTAATLADADVIWYRSAGITAATTAAKAPASSFFTVSGTYYVSVTASNWAAVTEIHFEQAAIRDWLRSSNFGAIIAKTTALTVFRAENNSAYSDSISSWVLPASTTYFAVFSTTVTGNIGGWTLPASLLYFYVNSSNVTGNISGWTLPASLIYLYLNDSFLSGDVSGWTFPATLVNLYMQGMSISGNIGGWTLPASLVNFAVSRNATISGDISGWTLPAGLVYFSVRGSAVTYGAAGTSFAGMTNGDSVYCYDCAWTAAQVNKALVNADAAPGLGAGTVLSMAGTNAAPTVGPPDGIAAKASLIAKGVTVTTS